MRNKKSNVIYYVLAIVLLLAIGAAVTLDFPIKQEQVEVTIQ